MEKAKVITMCGSLKFEDEIRKQTERLELEGNCVLSIIYPGNPNFDKDSYTIFVVNVNGYVGSSTKSEIAYAIAQGKEVLSLEPIE